MPQAVQLLWTEDAADFPAVHAIAGTALGSRRLQDLEEPLVGAGDQGVQVGIVNRDHRGDGSAVLGKDERLAAGVVSIAAQRLVGL